MKNSITESELGDAVHAFAESLQKNGVNLGPDSLCDLDDEMAAFLSENCALEVIIE